MIYPMAVTVAVAVAVAGSLVGSYRDIDHMHDVTLQGINKGSGQHMSRLLYRYY